MVENGNQLFGEPPGRYVVRFADVTDNDLRFGIAGNVGENQFRRSGSFEDPDSILQVRANPFLCPVTVVGDDPAPGEDGATHVLVGDRQNLRKPIAIQIAGRHLGLQRKRHVLGRQIGVDNKLSHAGGAIHRVQAAMHESAPGNEYNLRHAVLIQIHDER